MLPVFCYVLAYFILRVFVSDSLDWDESEQFINAQTFNLGDGRQPPLYSFIVKSLSLVFGMQPFTIISVRYICLLVFCLCLFLAAKELFKQEKAQYLTWSILAFIPAYAYTINFKLTHSCLVFALSSLSFYLFIRLYKNPCILNYYFFGCALGLGILAKYNFIFLILAMLATALCFRQTRALLFDLKIFISLLASLAVSLPHLIWLYENKFSSVTYAAGRSGSGLIDFNYFFKPFIFAFNVSEQLLIFVLIMAIFAFIKAKPKAYLLKSADSKLIDFIRVFAIWAFIIPVVFMTIIKGGKLVSGWLATTQFIIAFAVFSFVDLDKFSQNRKMLLTLVITLTILLLFCIKIITGFSPDTFGKVMDFNIPYKSISQQVYEIHKKIPGATIITNDQKLQANIKIRYPYIRVMKVANLKKDTEKRCDKILDRIKLEENYINSKRVRNFNLVVAKCP